MSALGQKQTCAAQKGDVRFAPNSDRESRHAANGMSALPPKADMCTALAHVRFGPKADMIIPRRLATGLLRLPRRAMPIFFVFLLRRKKLRRISRA